MNKKLKTSYRWLEDNVREGLHYLILQKVTGEKSGLLMVWSALIEKSEKKLGWLYFSLIPNLLLD